MPGTVLLWLAMLIAVSMIVFWPERGLLPRLMTWWVGRHRILLEDGLKFLYHRECDGHGAEIQDLAEALRLTPERTRALVDSLVTQGLCASTPEGLVLSGSGRHYAVRVLRGHRLWEQYLAERTGVPAGEWHGHAEQAEHKLTWAEAEDLSASLGHPVYDPHGDPIPLADGRMPPSRGVPLTTLNPGDTGRLVRLEDEPRQLYERLIALGLGPGGTIHVLAVSGDGMRVSVQGVEHSLDLDVAAGVTVELADSSGPVPGAEALSGLGVGDSARVVGITESCQGPQRRRLLDLGVVPGTLVRVEFASMSGDPLAYRIRGALIALRREQAGWILVRREAESAA